VQEWLNIEYYFFQKLGGTPLVLLKNGQWVGFYGGDFGIFRLKVQGILNFE